MIRFLSPWRNKRTDEYGGSEAVVGIRINGDEFIEGGLTQQDLRDMAVALANERIDEGSWTAPP